MKARRKSDKFTPTNNQQVGVAEDRNKCRCRRGDEDPCSKSKLYEYHNAGIRLEKLDTWEHITEAANKLAVRSEAKRGLNYLFRGQQCCSWGLKTPLDRCFEVTHTKKKREKIEGGLVRTFKRQFPQFRLPVPEDKNYMDWLALMRHHGAPTRLLDWTYTFYAAVFFAIEDLEGDTESAVWGISTDWLRDAFKRVTPPKFWRLVGTKGSDPNCTCHKTFTTVFLARRPFVINMNSYGQNERQVVQQATFLCPGDIGRSFEKNLLALVEGKQPNGQDDIIKYVITKDKEERKKILRRLHRMNMHRATLFPDLDGFAQSLKTRMLFEGQGLLFPDPEWRAAIAALRG